MRGKLVRHEYFLHGLAKIQSPKIKEKMAEKRGKKKSHVFWTEISTNKTFLFFPLLPISSFIFFLFLLLLIPFSALSFVCSSSFIFFFSYVFYFVHICLFSSSVLRYCVCVCMYIYFNEVSIHTQLN